MKPRSTEFLGSAPLGLSPVASPTSLRFAWSGSTPITPQTPNGWVSLRSSPTEVHMEREGAPPCRSPSRCLRSLYVDPLGASMGAEVLLRPQR
jgi:hypothetical protein